MFTGDVEPKLSVGWLIAPDGVEVMAAVNVTLPVKPFVGVTLMGNVFPVVAPAVTAIAGLSTVKATIETVTVTVAVPEAVL